MDRIKEALGLGPGTFALHLDANAVPAGGFLRGTYTCKLKKPTDIQGVLARATAMRDGQVIYEQTQRCDPVAQAVEERWVLIFRIPREIALPGELLPSELTGLSWSVTVKIELGLAKDPESSAHFEVVGPFADGVPTEQGPVSGTSLERVVNVLAADTVSAAARVSDRMIGVHTTPRAPDYEGGLAESHRAAERAAQRAADQVRQKFQSESQVKEESRGGGDEPVLERGPYDTQPLDQEPTRHRVDEPVSGRGPYETQPLDQEPTRRRVEKPPLRLDEPIPRRGRAEGQERRRVEKPPVRVEPVVREPAEPTRRRVEKPPVRVEPVVREPAEEPVEPVPERPAGESEQPETVRRRVEKPPVQVRPTPSRLPQPDYQSDESLRWKKPGRKK